MNKEIIEVYNKVYDLFSLNHLQSMEKNTQMEFSLSENDRFYLETLALLENPTISNFATAINVSQPAGTQIVNRFITKGYLFKEVSSQDKRVAHIKLSDKVVDYLSLCNEIEEANYNSILSKLSDEDKNNFLEILKKVKHILEES